MLNSWGCSLSKQKREREQDKIRLATYKSIIVYAIKDLKKEKMHKVVYYIFTC